MFAISDQYFSVVSSTKRMPSMHAAQFHAQCDSLAVGQNGAKVCQNQVSTNLCSVDRNRRIWLFNTLNLIKIFSKMNEVILTFFSDWLFQIWCKLLVCKLFKSLNIINIKSVVRISCICFLQVNHKKTVKIFFHSFLTASSPQSYHSLPMLYNSTETAERQYTSFLPLKITIITVLL